MCVKRAKESSLKLNAKVLLTRVYTHTETQLCNLPDVKGEILFQNIH